MIDAAREKVDDRSDGIVNLLAHASIKQEQGRVIKLILKQDVRIEFETRDQEQSKVDLECVTGHYKARQIAAKKAAGFKLYNQDYRGRSAERGEDFVGEVMSL